MIMSKETREREYGSIVEASLPKRRWKQGVVGLVILVLWVFSPLTDFSEWSERRSGSRSSEGTKHHDWADIISSRQLKYSSCYNDFQCARLDVPLNWNYTELSSGPRAQIAVVKLPSKVPVTDERYGGAIILNPGGPGESGVLQVLTGGKHIQKLLGEFFDIISFDPRTVNNTTPRLKCFPDPFNQQAWVLKYPDYGLLWDSESVIGLEWARAQALGGSCQREGEEEGIFRYANTAQTVEDMLEIVERHGEWRETEVAKLTCDREAVERVSWKRGQEKIQYWGISYGTLLGQTFAAMHPDRVDRLVIDGVLDPEDYYRGDWLKNLQDSDMIITKYCEYCFEAGPEKCPLFTGNSGADVEARFERIMMSLKTDPIPVPGDETRGPEVVTHGDMLLHMLTAMYFPNAGAELLFSMLADLDTGNGTRIAATKQQRLQAVELPPNCQRDGAFSEACISGMYVSGVGSYQAISCMDFGGGTNFTKEEFVEYVVKTREQGKWISTSWARNKLACVGYTVAPAWRFEGPIEGNTSHPMLIIGNTHDTVTPIRNARHVSTLFPGSVVLHHESEGHASFSNPSICTGKVLRRYFQTGELPKPETVCDPRKKPFIGCLDKDERGECRELEGEDLEIWQAWEGIIGVWP